LTVTDDYEQGPIGPAARFETYDRNNASRYIETQIDNKTGTYVFSAYVKSLIGPTTIFMRLRAASSGEWGFVDIDNEWTRIEYTGTLSAETMYVSIGLRYGGSSGSADFLISGAQVELAPGPSSYIPTSGAPVTRGADYLKYIDVDINEDISFLVDQESLYESDGYGDIDMRLVCAEGSVDPVVRGYGTAVHDGWLLQNPGAYRQPKSQVATQERHRLAVAWTASEGRMAFNGDLVYNNGTVGINQPHSVSDTYEIGHWSRTGEVYAGLFHRVMLFDEALSEEEVLDLSGNEYTCPEGK
jgi:hypothetical protein